MPVQAVCPKCRRPVSVGDDATGQAVRCPACATSFTIAPSADRGAKRAVGLVPPNPSGAGAGTGGLPALIGRYQVGRELGRGSFGVVYQARDPELGRDVAIKVLNSDALASPKAMERFLREARVVAQMHHNHVVPVFDFGRHGGASFIVSKFIAGQVLSQAIPEEGMDPSRATELAIQLLEALAYAHDMDVLHRDVKPANIILDERGQLYLMDFGLAGWVGQETGRMTQDGAVMVAGTPGIPAEGAQEAGRMTQDGAVMGTPAYMAPEQAKGDIRRVGSAADQYSADVVLYELLTGHLPFEGGPIQAVIYNVITTQAPPLSEWRDDIDPRLEAICLTALAKLPENRHRSCRDFADALRAWRGEGVEPVTVVPEKVMPPEGARPRDSSARATTSDTRRTTVSARAAKRTLVASPGEDAEEGPALGGGLSRRGWLLIVGGGAAVAVWGLAAGTYLATRKRGGEEPDARQALEPEMPKKPDTRQALEPEMPKKPDAKQAPEPEKPEKPRSVNVVTSYFSKGDNEGWSTQNHDGNGIATTPVKVDGPVTNNYWLVATNLPNNRKEWGWHAPAKFRGDHSDKFGRQLKYILYFSNVDNVPVTDWYVRLDGGGIVLFVDGTSQSPPPSKVWKPYSISLDRSGRWRRWLGAGRPSEAATDEDIKKVLGNVTDLRIKGDFSLKLGGGRPVPGGCLDNVEFGVEAIAPGQGGGFAPPDGGILR